MSVLLAAPRAQQQRGEGLAATSPTGERLQINFARTKFAPMKLNDWLDAERGRLAALAKHFGLTQSAVSQWRTNGVPPARMKAVRDYTGGAVGLDDMLPDPKLPRPEALPCIDVAAREAA